MDNMFFLISARSIQNSEFAKNAYVYSGMGYISLALFNTKTKA
jgi:hypothetical protein